ncbi:hypothetical protein OC846_001394 [Tilletia horrida]|uniref:Neuroguidin n=1 Tax=Tilletia horrida TaxID=155126 RepID=A0AAN6JTU0_9BASI|nr:hypothetical protein OC845_003336 [Tilletia horrida]KAK0556064.1 hypothetical protein OC846_001394 [Tilletia horrida]KAK0560593.1 hypothetical protein OC861_006221 [Tilletia horrida]
MSDFAQLIASLEKEASSLLPVADLVEERIASSSATEGDDGANGIPLLALKNDTLLSYIHHLVILTAYRLRGGDLGAHPGARLTEQLVRLRLILEKARPLERKLRYQIDKAVNAAEAKEQQPKAGISGSRNGVREKNGAGEDETGSEEEDDDDDDDEEVDTLAFRPNAAALMAASKSSASSSSNPAKASFSSSRSASATSGRRGRVAEASTQDDDDSDDNGVYRPPKLAPVPYDPDSVSSRGTKEDRLAKTGGKRNAALLADLSLGLSSNPYELSSAGLGGAGRNSASSAQASARAKALRRMEEYEEENFTRLVMKKKDAKRRRMDEAAVALGGAGLDSSSARRGRLGAGLDEEFGDLLRGGSGGGGRAGGKGKRKVGNDHDAYSALRSSSVKRAKVSDATLSGSSASSSARDLFRNGGGRAKQSQFSKDVARSRRKS